MDSYCYLISGTIAFFVCYYRIYVNARFHGHFFLIWKKAALLLYCIFYAVIAVALCFLLKDDVMQLARNNLVLHDKYVLSFGIGMIVKGIADVNLFNIKYEGTIYPFGLRTITQPLDRFFEEKFDACLYIGRKIYLKPYEQCYETILRREFGGDLVSFRDNRMQEIRNYHTDKEKVLAFESSEGYDKVKTVKDLLGVVLKEFGRTIFEDTFPKI